MTAKFEVSVSIEPEHEDVRGHFASGEPEYDRQDEEAILARLSEGDEWAWCVVKVTVLCGRLSESEYLGGCSYESEEDFRANSGYFDDMVDACKRALVRDAKAVMEAAEAEGFTDDGAL